MSARMHDTNHKRADTQKNYHRRHTKKIRTTKKYKETQHTTSNMGSIWENYDSNAKVEMEDKSIVNLKIDGRVLLSKASDLNIEFMDNGRNKNPKKCVLTGVLVMFRGSTSI